MRFEIEGCIILSWLPHRGCVVVTEAGSYLRLIYFCITRLKAQGPSRTCNESKEEEKKSYPIAARQRLTIAIRTWLRLEGLGFRVQGFESRVEGLGSMAYGVWLSV